jgi:hypothetical protein
MTRATSMCPHTMPAAKGVCCLASPYPLTTPLPHEAPFPRRSFMTIHARAAWPVGGKSPSPSTDTSIGSSAGMSP